MKTDLYIHKVVARDLPDLWFQAVVGALDHGRTFIIDRGSYAGQTRLEFDYFLGHVKNPSTQPILPDIPSSCGIPNPVEYGYIYGGKGYSRSYIEYIMTPTKEKGESYTYGERLTKFLVPSPVVFWRKQREKGEEAFQDIVVAEEIWNNTTIVEYDPVIDGYYINQINLLIHVYKKYGHRNNQMVLQIAQGSDCLLQDPPCLRQIDTRIQDGKLHFVVYFRSWDLWAGLPANLAGIQALKEHMASEIGVEDGEMIVESKGLHLYGYAEELAKMRCMKE